MPGSESPAFAVALLLSVAIGSTQTNGDPPETAPAEPPVAGGVDFATQIKPIFESRCYECHDGHGRKGGLLLDRRDGVFKPGDETKWNIRPGNAAESPLYYRITLPKGDLDVMPAEGDPLTTEQIELIRRWIVEGAVWPESADDSSSVDRIELKPLTEAERAAETQALDALATRGILAMRIAADTDGLYVNYSLLGRDATGDDVALLAGLEPTLVWLNLSRTQVMDESLDHLVSMKQLRRLSLQNSGIGDEGLRRIAELKELRYLNLYGTRVTDAGLKRLHGLENLRSIYLWQSAVTEEGASALAAALPKLRVDLGNYTIATQPAPMESAAPAADLTCCDIAKAAGKACDHPCCVEAVAKGEICLKCNPKKGAGQSP